MLKGHERPMSSKAYAKLQFRDLALFKIFASTIRRSPPNGFGEQQLSLLCNAYARLEVPFVVAGHLATRVSKPWLSHGFTHTLGLKR